VWAEPPCLDKAVTQTTTDAFRRYRSPPPTTALRLIMNEGTGFADIAVPLGILVAWGLASFVAALWLFRWE